MKSNKNILLSLCAILLLLIGCDKDDISSFQSKSFIKFFGSSGVDLAGNVLPLPDGSYAVIGTIATSNAGTDIYYFHTDDKGNLMETPKNFGGPLNDIGYDMVLESDGNILLLGSIQDTLLDGSINRDAYLIKVSPDGEMISSETIGSDLDEEGLDLIALSGGGYAIGGYQIRDNSKDFWIVLLLSDYTVQHNRTEGWPTTDEEITSINETSNGGFMCIGNKSSASGVDITSVTFDHNGRITGEHTETKDGNDNEGNTINVNSQFINISTTQNSTSNTSGILLSEVSFDGSVITFTTINQIDNPDGSITGNAICALSDGNYSIIGTIEITGNEDIYLTKVDANGNELWSEYKSFGKTGSQRGVAIQEANDGGFIILGTNSFDNNSMITLLKTKPDGSL